MVELRGIKKKYKGHPLVYALGSKVVTVVVLAAASGFLPNKALGNGLQESRPWQFETSHEKAAKASVLDIRERKKGGFYDGFTNIVNNTTNIGSQINCSNGATASANVADNGQVGASPTSAPQTDTAATSAGNQSQLDPAGSDGSAPSGAVEVAQGNDGTLSANVDGTSVVSRMDNVSVGSTDQLINNEQSNSGNLSADIADSIACALDGAALTGAVNVQAKGLLSSSLN